MNIEQARFNMIEQQIRTWDVLDSEILDLLTRVKREDFVPPAYRRLAFVDMEIPLPGGENMLAPKVEARFLQALAVRAHETVLEIGSGSGYMAALLAARAQSVITVEIAPELKAFAQHNLSKAAMTNVQVELGNGIHGWTNPGTVDVVMISGSMPNLPEKWLEQVKVGGRIAAIIGESPLMTAQLITRTGNETWEHVNLFETDITPLRAVPHVSRFSF